MEPTAKRTEYAIRLTIGVWAGERRHWVDSPERAKHYATMTAATIAGIFELGFAPDEFTVEAV